MALAIPSQSFSDVQRYLKQKRAGGQTVTPRETRLAWQAYWDVNAARSLQSKQLSLNERSINANIDINKKRMKLAKEQMQREEDAATISGISELGSTAAIGAYALKGTSIGSKIGLGAAPTVSGGAGTAVSGGAASGTGFAGSPAGGSAGAGLGGAGVGATGASTAPTATSAGFSNVGTSAVGAIGAGYAGSTVGGAVSGNDAGSIIGGIAGGVTYGAYVGGPAGAIVGGLVGGAVGVVKSIKD